MNQLQLTSQPSNHPTNLVNSCVQGVKRLVGHKRKALVLAWVVQRARQLQEGGNACEPSTHGMQARAHKGTRVGSGRG